MVTGTEQIPVSNKPRALARPDAVLVCRPQWRSIVPLILLTTVLLDADYASACPVCFGDPESEMAQGAMWGIMVLGIVIYGVLMGMVAIGATWFIRARKHGV